MTEYLCVLWISLAGYSNTDNNQSRKYKINDLNKHYNIFFLRRANLLPIKGHPVIIIRALSQTTHIMLRSRIEPI